jgi:hypothetical protein
MDLGSDSKPIPTNISAKKQDANSGIEESKLDTKV